MGLIKGIIWMIGLSMILVGIAVMFIPAVGLFIGIPLIAAGYIVIRLNKNTHIKERKLLDMFSGSVVMVTKSKPKLSIFVIGLMIIVAFTGGYLQFLPIPFIIYLLVAYARLKHEEWLKEEKSVSRRWYHFAGKPVRWFGAGMMLLIAGVGLFYLIVHLSPSYINHTEIRESRIFTPFEIFSTKVVFGIAGTLLSMPIILLGLWFIRFSYRNPEISGIKSAPRYRIIEPGKTVISRKGIQTKESATKKKGKPGIGLFLLALLIIPFSYAQSCLDIGAIECSKSQICEGQETSYNLIASCCIGQCIENKQLSCSGISSLNFMDNADCEIKTLNERIRTNYVNSPDYFISLLNPTLPKQPYPEMWNFWRNVSLTIGGVLMLLTTISLFYSYIKRDLSSYDIAKYRGHYILTFFAGLILLALPYILTIAFHLVDAAFLLVVKYFVREGDILHVFRWLTNSYTDSLLYLLRNLLYFLFLIVLLIRFAVLYILLVFLPIIIVLYSFYSTEYIGGILLRKLFLNLIMPVVWIFSFALINDVFQNSTPFLMPLFLAAVLYFNIWLYRKITGLDFSFSAMARKAYGYLKKVPI